MPYLRQCFLSSECLSLENVSIRIGLQNTAFGLVLVFCSCHHLLQREVSLVRGGVYNYLVSISVNISRFIFRHCGLVK